MLSCRGQRWAPDRWPADEPTGGPCRGPSQSPRPTPASRGLKPRAGAGGGQGTHRGARGGESSEGAGPPAGAGMQRSSPSRVGLGAHRQGLIRGPWREAPDLAGGPGERVTGSGSESCWVTSRAGSGLGPGGEAEAGLSLEEQEKAARWSIPWAPPLCSHRCWLWTQGSSLVRSLQLSPAVNCAAQRLPGS